MSGQSMKPLEEVTSPPLDIDSVAPADRWVLRLGWLLPARCREAMLADLLEHRDRLRAQGVAGWRINVRHTAVDFVTGVKPSELLRDCLKLRAGRIGVLLVFIAIASAVDLLLTLQYIVTKGLAEANPIARLLVAQGSPMLLVLWKIVAAGVAIYLLYRCRRARAAELGAWICAITLMWLTLRWFQYAAAMEKIGETHSALSAGVRPDVGE